MSHSLQKIAIFHHTSNTTQLNQDLQHFPQTQHTQAPQFLNTTNHAINMTSLYEHEVPLRAMVLRLMTRGRYHYDFTYTKEQVRLLMENTPDDERIDFIEDEIERQNLAHLERTQFNASLRNMAGT